LAQQDVLIGRNLQQDLRRVRLEVFDIIVDPGRIKQRYQAIAQDPQPRFIADFLDDRRCRQAGQFGRQCHVVTQ
jgi:hypothetical protein